MFIYSNFAPLELLVTITCTLALHNLDYSDLETMGVACSPRDTCALPSTRNFLSTNCECDSECYLYSDCCIDAPQTMSRTRMPRTGITCMPYNPPYYGVYTINRCQRSWRGAPEIRQKCESIEDFSDPIIASPATDPSGDVTYKNRYCAECNGADLDQLTTWTININCDSLAELNSTYRNLTDEYVMEHITYDEGLNKWGLYYWNSSESRETFRSCALSFDLPSYLESNVRLCRPNVTATCAPNWRRNTVRRQCESYMAVVYFDTAVYKNPHCALCNHKNIANRACTIGIHSRNKPALSFTLLLDVNMSDGNRVGMTRDTRDCPGNQKWDPFFKKCRKLVCALPGYQMVNGRCVRS